MKDDSGDSRFLGTVMLWLGLGLCAVGIVLLLNGIIESTEISEVQRSIRYAGAAWVKMLVGLCSVFAGFIFLRLGGLRTVRTAQRVRYDDRRKPVVYLRSFQHDRHNTHRPDNPLWDNTIEQRMADQFLPIGPMIAIGDPDDVRPLLGVPRIYLDRWESRTGTLLKTEGPETNWWNYARSLMKEAALIVVSYDVSDGLNVESDHIFTHEPLTKVLFLFREHRRWIEFRQRYARYFSDTAPSANELVHYLAFTEAAQPYALSHYRYPPGSAEATQSDFFTNISPNDEKRIRAFIASHAHGEFESDISRWLRRFGLKH